MRLGLALLVLSSGSALADQISGKWTMSNGNKLIIVGNTWKGSGYAGRNYNSFEGTITRTSPSTFKFNDVNGMTRECKVAKNRVTCSPFGASWRRR